MWPARAPAAGVGDAGDEKGRARFRVQIRVRRFRMQWRRVWRLSRSRLSKIPKNQKNQIQKNQNLEP
jgi:hypothetical protein